MKLLLLKSAPRLTKAGKPSKKQPRSWPTRLFTEDGREIDGLVSIQMAFDVQPQFVSYSRIDEPLPIVQSKPVVAEMTITLSYPDVVLVTEPPLLRHGKLAPHKRVGTD